MMNATQPLDSNLGTSSSPRLRVVDVGRWLWLLTAAVLVLGWIAVRELSGVSDAPRVEATDGTPIEAAQPTSESAKGEIPFRTLIPVTSQEPFAPAGGESTGSPLGAYQSQHDDWPPLTTPLEAASDTPVVK